MKFLMMLVMLAPAGISYAASCKVVIQPGAKELSKAAEIGDLETLKALLTKHSPNLPYYNGTPLHHAAMHGRDVIVAELLQQRADVNPVDHFGSTPLLIAASKGHAKIVQQLLNAGAKAHHTNKGGHTPLRSAVTRGHANVVEILVQKEQLIDPHLLHIASQEGHREVLTCLLDHSSHQIDAPDECGATALCLALINSHTGMVEELLARKASLEVHTTDRRTPIHFAAASAQPNLVSLILSQHGPHTAHGNEDIPAPIKQPDVNVRTLAGRTPLHFAAASHSTSVVALLLQHHATIDAQDDEGITPLMLASSYCFDHLKPGYEGHIRIAKLLLREKADPNISAKNGNTALHVAATYGQREIIEALLLHGAKIDAKTKDGRGLTAFDLAAHPGHQCKEVVSLLLVHSGASAESCQQALRSCVDKMQDPYYAKRKDVSALLKELVALIIVHNALVHTLDCHKTQNSLSLLQYLTDQYKQHNTTQDAGKATAVRINVQKFTPAMVDAIIYGRLVKPSSRVMLESCKDSPARRSYLKLIHATSTVSGILSERLRSLLREEPLKQNIKDYIDTVCTGNQEMRTTLTQAMAISHEKLEGCASRLIIH